MKSLFPYMGGKHRVARKLISMFPEHSCYVEVFAGAINVLFAKDRSRAEVVNDINQDIVTIFRVLRWHPDEFLKELAYILHSRQEFHDYHDQPGLTDIQKAVRYWYRLKTTFGGTGSRGDRNFGFGTSRSSALNNQAYETILQAHERLNGVFIENLDFQELIGRYDRDYTLFFCDPPYWQTGDYGVPFEWSDHERLARSLRAIKGKFLLTINDHADIRKLYSGLPRLKVDLKYTVSRSDKARERTWSELVIANFPLPKRW